MSSEKKTNICAILGCILTLVNIAVSVVLIVIGKTAILLPFAAVLALVSLILCACGVSNAKASGKGRGISIFGIVLNALILIAVALFTAFIVIFAKACAGLFQGLSPN